MPRPKTVTDDAILAVARATFLKDGAGASTRTIARDAGISEAVIFQRFGTKDGLFFAAMVPPPADLDRIFAVEPGVGPVVANLERIGLGILGYFRTMIPVFLPLVSHPAFDRAAFQSHHSAPAMRLGERLQAYLGAEAELGRIGKKHAGATGHLLLSFLHNTAIGESIGVSRPEDAPEAVAKALAAMWEGIGVMKPKPGG